MILTVFRAGILIGISAFFYSCDRLSPLPKAPVDYVAPAPARDEFYRFSAGALSISTYDVLRREFPDVSATDLSQLAQTAQWLAPQLKRPESIPLSDTARCVRSLFSPHVSESARAASTRFLLAYSSFSSLSALLAARDAAIPGWAVVWNPDLVREYGIVTSR